MATNNIYTVLLFFLTTYSLPMFSSSATPATLIIALDREQRAVVTYVGNFLTKMLTELNSGSLKSPEHVRAHLLPYLGGLPALDALLIDDMNNGTCSVCYRSNETRSSLLNLRNLLTAEQLEAYDEQSACYHTLTNRIMEKLPVNDRGDILLPAGGIESDSQTKSIMESLFKSKQYNAVSCRAQAMQS
ncbi:hypothetical protein CEUSTIGMA_g5185.t1 [Chlamydomonas eustigma]|uniref:Uncharacterized protein n=1 Tax=Chlamydomonas eustigma TaxID=1157962 RepID=A0A250X4C2_9CHLO|nr:hypothetical protein CEUSTIGMA_g5185.t1 [Chlamydomonas eustigma]|eukprot:GAX77742.1 hypothetical protein CEUSTIGMA_g5185.t1 [Chlamydomonas eustigma]